MKQRETRSLVVTGCFVAVLLALIGARVAPAGSDVEHTARPAVDQYVPDAQFAQYLEYRIRLEHSSNCQ